MQPLTRLTFVAVISMIAIAIVVQDVGNAVPWGLFNTGRGVASLVSWVSLTACIVALAVLLLEFKRGRPSAAGSLVRVTVALVVTLELLVTATDIAGMSRRADALVDVPVLDAAQALEGRVGMYRSVDTHLSDLGNVVAGHWAAARLDTLLEGE